MLLNCPECKKTLSDRAANCPYCGFPFGDMTVVACPTCNEAVWISPGAIQSRTEAIIAGQITPANLPNDYRCASCGLSLGKWMVEKALPVARRSIRKVKQRYVAPYVFLAIAGLALTIFGFTQPPRTPASQLPLIVGIPSALVGLIYLAAFYRLLAFTFVIGGLILFWMTTEYKSFGAWNTALFGIGLALAFIGLIGGFFRNLAER